MGYGLRVMGSEEEDDEEGAPDGGPPVAAEELLEIDEHDGEEDEFGNDHRQTVHMIERQSVEKDHGDHADHLELAEDIGDRRHYLREIISLDILTALNHPFGSADTGALAPYEPRNEHDTDRMDEDVPSPVLVPPVVYLIDPLGGMENLGGLLDREDILMRTDHLERHEGHVLVLGQLDLHHPSQLDEDKGEDEEHEERLEVAVAAAVKIIADHIARTPDEMPHRIEDIARTESPCLHESEHGAHDGDTLGFDLTLTPDEFLLRLVSVHETLPREFDLLAKKIPVFFQVDFHSECKSTTIF